MKDNWMIQKKNVKTKLKNAVLIVGLPGIGNVGKITADFLVDDLKATEVYKISSSYFPHSVFISDESILEMPTVYLHIVKSGAKSNQDIILLSGDIQPMDEQASYKFCDKILDLAQELGCNEVITVGGIGLPGEPKKPKVYGVATSKATKAMWAKATKSVHFKDNKAATIVGATGLMLGLGTFRKMEGISLLAETVGHPYHLGLKEATEVLKVLEKKLKLKINLNKIKKEIKKSEIEHSEQAKESHENVLMKKLKRFSGETQVDTSYIG
jgi:uncharacterized protein